MECTLNDIYAYVRVQYSFTVGHMSMRNDQYLLLLLKGALRHAVPGGVPWGGPFPNRIG